MSAAKNTTHILIERQLVVYRRERSAVWQCRYSVDGVWQRNSTQERDIKLAKRAIAISFFEAYSSFVTGNLRVTRNTQRATRKSRNRR